MSKPIRIHYTPHALTDDQGREVAVQILAPDRIVASLTVSTGRRVAAVSDALAALEAEACKRHYLSVGVAN